MEFLSSRARRVLEVCAVLSILAAGLVPRARDLGASFDREFDGWQGAFFAISAVNYARVGVGEFSGYPIQDIDLPRDAAGELDRGAVTLYANHPPLVPLVAWAAAELFGPDGWEDPAAEPPYGLEPALRTPFFLFHLAALLAFYLAIREAAGPQRALLSLAVLAATPVAIVYAGLVNYENPALAFVLTGLVFHLRYLKHGRALDAALFGVAALLGCAVTFFHLFFLPGLCLYAVWRGQTRRGVVLGTAALAGALLPIVLHGWLSAAAYEETGKPPSLLAGRIREMLAPLLDGTIPFTEWFAFQVRRAARFFSVPLLVTAALGVLVALRAGFEARSKRRSREDSEDALDPSIPLLAGGALVLLVMYRHTADGWNGGDGQVPFLLHLAPGIAAAAGVVLDRLAAPLYRMKGGLAPLVVLTSLVCLPAIVRSNELRLPWREPGPRDAATPGDEEPPLVGPASPLPATVGEELRALLPPGSTGIYPAELGFTPAHLYYAWRALSPVDTGDPGSIAAATARLGTHGGDAWLVVPRTGTTAAVTAGTELHAYVAERVPLASAPDASSEHWFAWKLPR